MEQLVKCLSEAAHLGPQILPLSQQIFHKGMLISLAHCAMQPYNLRCWGHLLGSETSGRLSHTASHPTPPFFLCISTTVSKNRTICGIIWLISVSPKCPKFHESRWIDYLLCCSHSAQLWAWHKQKLKISICQKWMNEQLREKVESSKCGNCCQTFEELSRGRGRAFY